MYFFQISGIIHYFIIFMETIHNRQLYIGYIFSVSNNNKLLSLTAGNKNSE